MDLIRTIKMKSISILIILSTLMTLFPSFRNTEYTNLSATVSITFGRPSAGNCTGRGTCSIEETTSRRTDFKITDSTAKGIISVNQEGQLVLKIFKETINEKTIEEQFPDGNFIIHDDLELPKKLKRKLRHRKNNAGFKSGQYRVKEDKGDYTIVLN